MVDLTLISHLVTLLLCALIAYVTVRLYLLMLAHGVHLQDVLSILTALKVLLNDSQHVPPPGATDVKGLSAGPSSDQHGTSPRP